MNVVTQGVRTQSAAHITSSGFSPFLWTCFTFFSRWTDAFPALCLRPGSGPAPTRNLPPHTGEGRTEKGERKKGEYEAASEWEGWNKWKADACPRVIQHFKNVAMRACGEHGFLPLSHLHFQYLYRDTESFLYSPDYDKRTAVWLKSFLPFPDPWGDKHAADVDTPGNYPTNPPHLLRSWIS